MLERAGARLRCEFHGVGPESGSERLVAALEDDHDDDLLAESGVAGIDNLWLDPARTHGMETTSARRSARRRFQFCDVDVPLAPWRARSPGGADMTRGNPEQGGWAGGRCGARVAVRARA